jgi:GNAT superfamily N-acetyltransferase
VSTRAAVDRDGVRTAFEIQLRCNGVPEDVLPQWLEPMVEDFDPQEASLVLAEVDGVPVASASAVPTPDGVWLTGAGTLPEARGRGAYRALVAARWREAVDAGTPALVVQAGSMSRPLLERMGFAAVGELTYYRDELA